MSIPRWWFGFAWGVMSMAIACILDISCVQHRSFLRPAPTHVHLLPGRYPPQATCAEMDSAYRAERVKYGHTRWSRMLGKVYGRRNGAWYELADSTVSDSDIAILSVSR